MGIGWGELVVILIIALLIFGAHRIPEIGRALGKGIQEFKKGMNEPLSEENIKSRKRKGKR